MDSSAATLTLTPQDGLHLLVQHAYNAAPEARVAIVLPEQTRWATRLHFGKGVIIIATADEQPTPCLNTQLLNAINFAGAGSSVYVKSDGHLYSIQHVATHNNDIYIYCH